MEAADRHGSGPTSDPSWEHYTSTVLELLADRSLVIDLTRPVAAQAVAALGEHGIGPCFAVITACDPGGRPLGETRNGRFTNLLQVDIVAAGRPWVPADGVSPNGSHREPGFAVSLGKTEARVLACRYGQSAFYWFDGASMWLVGAVVVTADRKLPV